MGKEENVIQIQETDSYSILEVEKKYSNWNFTTNINENYKALLDNSLDGICVVYDSKFVYVNRSFIKIFRGSNESDFINLPINKLLHPNFHTIASERINRILELDDIPERMEQQMYTVDGQLIDVEVIGFSTIFQGEKAVQVIIRDITEQKRNHHKLIQSEKLNTVGHLAASIAHEIRNPLTSLKGFLQLADSEEQIVKRYIPIMRSEIERIELIASELLTLANPVPLEFNKANIITIIEEVILLVEIEAGNKEVTIHKNFDHKQIFIKLVESQLKQVLLNLIKNAMESINGKGDITLEVKCTETKVYLHVHDNGTGMSKSVINEIFEPFFTTKPNGTGLGLMITKKIVENHEGVISVKSIEGEGTTFTIELPLILKL
ncbi:ATP-binding protein [Bacillus sp. 31A1R]|uniref:histidine kinase n=1 Tax=Robertmurraya mangrovi TaxID=3098077 RepID=A0ABU5J3D7_9BACI|nr:ATP-binding protein [Bacillus sp. 31A1R]MDZ5473914.1 ATP-binding protein [Bacillus sp. 31A1R]